MAPRKHTGGGWIEQLQLLLTMVRVLRGEDPKRVRQQTGDLVERSEKLKDEISQYTGESTPASEPSKPSKPGAADG